MGQTRHPTAVRWSLAGQEGLDSLPMRISCADPDSFRTRGTQWTFGDVMVSEMTHTPCRIQPDHGSAATDSAYVSAIFVLSGSYRIVDTGQHFVFDMGAAGWFPGWSRVSGECTETSRIARVSVPRESLQGADRGHQPIGRFDGPMILRSSALAFVLELLSGAEDPEDAPADQDEVQDGSAHPAAAALTTLLSGMFLEQRELASFSGSVAELWANAMAVIDREYRDALLDPVGLAARLHISLRHLQRAFAQNGSTISDAIRDRRADAAAALLAGTGGRDLSLSNVALVNGFSSIKEMRFALRSRHGMTPRQFRSASATAVLATNG